MDNEAYRVTLANGCARVVNAGRNTVFLQLVAQCPYERLEIAVRAQWNNQCLGRRNSRWEGQDATGLVLLTSPVNVLTESLFLLVKECRETVAKPT